MATDKHAVVWTRAGAVPMKMGSITVTDRECRFSYERDFLEADLPGIGVLFNPSFVKQNTVSRKRTEGYDLFPALQTLIPPRAEDNFQRRLVTAYLKKLSIDPGTGFDLDWNILMVAGHGGIGHLDVFTDDDKAVVWYKDKALSPFYTTSQNFGFSLKDFLNFYDVDARPIIDAIGPTPTVRGMIPKLLLAIPASGWDGQIALPSRTVTKERTDVVLKFERSETYPGIVELEALTLDLHRRAGFEVPRFWTLNIKDVPGIAIERFDRVHGKPILAETLYSIMKAGDERIANHYDATYDYIAAAYDKSPIPIVSRPAEEKRLLAKRLILAMLTGNGDLHMDNLSIIYRDGELRASPVYDPTPMSAYSRHRMLNVMPFGDYAQFDETTDEIVPFITAIPRFGKSVGLTKKALGDMIDECLTITDRYAEEVDGLSTYPGTYKEKFLPFLAKTRLLFQEQLLTLPLPTAGNQGQNMTSHKMAE